MNQIDVEMDPINGSFPSQISSTYQHANNAAELLNQTYHLANVTDDKDFQIIYEEELELNGGNSTVQALVMANLVDEILRKYGKAYDIQ